MKKERIPTNTDNSSNLLVNFQKIDKDGDIFKQMFKYSVVPTIIHDMKMNIINANDRAVEQFGYSRQELLKKKIFDLHTENELNHSKEVLNEMQQKDKLSVETSFKRKDGSIFFAEATPCKFLLSNKPIIHVFIQDISERKKTEIELKDYNKQLNNRNKELEQFTYITSHDLQEPLNSIISFAGLLNEDKEKLDELGAKSVTVILNSAQRMKDFITSILDYSRIGKRQEITTVDIRKLIENLKIDLTDLIEKENATLSYIGESLKIMAFKHDLIKLFQNIVSNGIKYSKKDTPPKIEINLEEQPDKYLFIISDNGIGIEKNQFEKIFEVFQRLHPRDKYTGTGIGLAHCKKIVEMHNGSIWLTSEIGKGSTFYFTISKKL